MRGRRVAHSGGRSLRCGRPMRPWWVISAFLGGGTGPAGVAAMQSGLGRWWPVRMAGKVGQWAMPASRPCLSQTLQSFGDISRFLREAWRTRIRARCATAWVLAQVDRTGRRAMRATRRRWSRSMRKAWCRRCESTSVSWTGLARPGMRCTSLGRLPGALRELRCGRPGKRRWSAPAANRRRHFDRMELLAWRTLGEGCCSSICMSRADPAQRPVERHRQRVALDAHGGLVEAAAH